MLRNARQPAAATLQGRRVLIVEDEMLLAMEFESLLAGEGCTVVGPASTVERALASVEQERPDAALLDLNLHGQETTPVAAALSARGVPFLLVTGYGKKPLGTPELRNAPRLDKPVNHQALVRALVQLLDAS